MHVFSSGLVFTALFLTICSHNTAAATFNFFGDWQRGEPGSAYLEWQSFTDAALNATPDIGNTHILTSTLQEQSGRSFIASSNNIYSLASQFFNLTLVTNENGPVNLGNDVQVQMQVSSWGSKPDLSSFKLNGVKGSARETYAGLDKDTNQWPQYDYLISWSIRSSNLFYFQFNLPSPHSSLNGLAVDLFGLSDSIALTGLPELPLFPPLPGDPVFNGTPLNAAYFLPVAGNTTSKRNGLQQGVTISNVPLPSSLVFLVSALGAMTIRKRISHNTNRKGR